MVPGYNSNLTATMSAAYDLDAAVRQTRSAKRVVLLLRFILQNDCLAKWCFVQGILLFGSLFCCFSSPPGRLAHSLYA